MDLHSEDDLLQRSKLKILVVPISPISKKDFTKYLQLLKPFSAVSLAELTPPDSKTGCNFGIYYSQIFAGTLS